MKTQSPISPNEFLLFRKGDTKVFEVIYYFYFDLVFQKVFRLVRSSEVAEEIVQESFTQLFLNREKLQDAEALFPYLYVVSKRLSISYFRKKVVREQYRDYAAQEMNRIAVSGQKVIEENDLIEIVKEAIAELPEQQGLIYHMNKMEDRPYKEIAEVFGLSVHTVRNHIANASKVIRIKLNNFFTLFFIILFLFFT